MALWILAGFGCYVWLFNLDEAAINAYFDFFCQLPYELKVIAMVGMLPIFGFIYLSFFGILATNVTLRLIFRAKYGKWV